MRNLDKEYIAVGFDNDSTKIIPVIKMSGADGLKKVIHDVSGISNISVYHINFIDQKIENIRNIPWSDPSLKSDVMIQYEPAAEHGTVCINATGTVWCYEVHDKAEGETMPIITDDNCDVFPKNPNDNTEKKSVVDKDKVRQIEQEGQTKILWPDELAVELRRDIFGQDEAIRKISELISANIRRKTPEVEVIVLFGPTGVGKTEVGKALPGALEKLTGQKYGFQQIALNEFIGEHSLNRWFGSPPSYVGYKDPTIFEPCRSNKYQVFLLDEIEKSTDRIWTGLMECFSSGVVKLADNSPDIDLSHSIFIITSNIPIDMQAYNAASAFRKKEICRDTLSKACGHPEIAGKITNCLAFQPLPADALTDIVGKFVIQELQNYEMELEHMDEHLMVQLKEQHSNYGARGVKDAVREALTNATVYDRNISRYKGRKVALTGNIENILIEIIS